MPGYQYRGNQPDTERPIVRPTPRPSKPKETPVPVVKTTPAKPKLPVWEEPPAAKRAGRRGDKQRIVEALKQHPGKWARVTEGLKSSSASAEWKKLGCEAVSRKPEGSNLYAVWARWPEGGQ